MSVCTQCGHDLGVGRYCVNCGHPVGAAAATASDDWRTDTAERSVVPLVADDADVSSGSHRHLGNRPVRGAGWLPWVATAAILLLFAGGGFWLLTGGDDDPEPAKASSPSEPTSQAPETTSPPSPTAEPTEQPSDEPEPEDVARAASVSVPRTAPPNQDVDGNQVRYDARHLLDGVPETTWRMPGDGSGESLVIQLAAPTTVTSVGLVNGYAKTARSGGGTFDWYAGNRRVLAVEWVFDDGTAVEQDLAEVRELQAIEVDGLTTERLELRLVTVSSPGGGPSGRDYTAISELSVIGVPG